MFQRGKFELIINLDVTYDVSKFQNPKVEGDGIEGDGKI